MTPKETMLLRARKNVLHYIRQQLIALRAAGAHNEIATSLRSLSAYVERADIAELEKMLISNTAPLSQTSESNSDQQVMNDRDVEQLTIAQVEELIQDPDINKAILERIAQLRFGVTRGLSRKSTKASLLMKIESLVSNEKGHEAIRRLTKPKHFSD